MGTEGVSRFALDGFPNPNLLSKAGGSGIVRLMPRWFLSYNSQDLALMQGLEAALRSKDPTAHIYFAPTSVRAGGFWLPSLANEIAQATVFVLLVGRHGVGPWQVMEYYEALGRRVNEHHEHPDAHEFPVVLMLLEGQPAPGLPFLRQLHWIVTAEPSAEKSLGLLMDAASGAGTRPSKLWQYTAPYRGLAAMTESDSDFFFGRTQETIEVIKAFEETPNKLALLLGNSGVGKSSLAQAGVLAAFMRQAWPETAADRGLWPAVFQDSRQWCFLKLQPGHEPLRALVEPFLRTWQFDATDPDRAKLQSKWIDNLLEGAVGLRDLIDATELRYGDELHLPKPPAFFLYVDQGEELYVRAEARQRSRFSQILAEGVADPRLYVLMSVRADFFGELLNDEPLQNVARKIEVPPLRELQLLEVVTRPAQLLSASYDPQELAAEIAQRTAEESAKDAGALPLLSYLLDDMWTAMVRRGDGKLRLPKVAVEIGAVLVDRADAFLATHLNSEDKLCRIFTLRLATVSEDGKPTRRRAPRSEFSDDEWRLVSELADHPNRLLVTATSDAIGTYAEVAHEAIFRRWKKLSDWMAAEHEFLAWRTGLESARRAWQTTPARSKNDALLMGLALAKAESWHTKRGEDLLAADREFIHQSAKAEQQRRRRTQMLIGGVVAAIAVSLVAWVEHDDLNALWRYATVIRPFAAANIWPYVLTTEAERALKPGPNSTFRECASEQGTDYCPEMIVVPAGSFTMGSPSTENGRSGDEGPQHNVTIAHPFAVSKYALTFEEWDTCVANGYCLQRPQDLGWGRGRQPVIYVSWDDAQQYVAWLATMTGKPYRLLTEAEYEYAARAGTQTAYPWSGEIKLNGQAMANCTACGSQWDGKQTAPVGSFAANGFGLYDMVGNVWQWTEDCHHNSYVGAPPDRSAWSSGDCSRRIVRGGSWSFPPGDLRSASRGRSSHDDRDDNLGFRVARTLTGAAGER